VTRDEKTAFALPVAVTEQLPLTETFMKLVEDSKAVIIERPLTSLPSFQASLL